MREWFIAVTEISVTIIDGLALLLIIVGTIEAFVGGLRALLTSADGHHRRDVWLRYARWLVAGLTFQLAADIIETSIRTDWTSIGLLAAIAVIRTFLNYFLERDLEDMRKHQENRVPQGQRAEPPA